MDTSFANITKIKYICDANHFELMKRILTTVLIFSAFFGAYAQNGAVTYALPQTTLHFEVEAVLEYFHAGPYAKYAQKYLGQEARLENKNTCHISSVRLVPCVEADQSARFSVSFSPKGNGAETFLQMSSQGLVSVSDGSFGQQSIWRFPSAVAADFSNKGVSSNITSESTVLYRNVREQSVSGKVSVQQNMVVAKSAEERAKEAADMIVNLRKTRIAIVTGDTDATFSGEAMAAAVKEISELEEEYLSLFMGYSDFQPQTMTFDVVPQKGTNMYIAFRASETDGLVTGDDASGKPYILDVTPETVPSVPASKDKAVIYYRIPAICNVKLMDGTKVLLQSRVPVYQLGTNSTFPINQ